jgi:hypothetical protein
LFPPTIGHVQCACDAILGVDPYLNGQMHIATLEPPSQ